MNGGTSSRPIRLLAVVHHSRIGGTEVCFGRLLTALAHDPDFEVCGAYPRDGELAAKWDALAFHIEYQAGALPEAFHVRGYRDWLRRRGVESRDFETTVSKWEPDIIVSFTSVLTAPLVVAANLGVPAVAYVREFLGPDVVRPLLWRYLARHARRLIAVSSCVAEGLERYAPGRVLVVPDGVPLPRVQHLATWPPSPPQVAFYGGYNPRKGGELFVRMAGVVQGIAPSVRFVYYGVADAGQEGQRDVVRRLTEGLGLRGILQFAETTDFGSSFGENSVVVVPSEQEGLGLVALDAMSYGVPVVASRTGGLTDVVEDGVTGILAGVGDTDDFSAAVMRIVCDEATVRVMGTAARARVERMFTLERAVEGLKGAVRETLRESSP